MKHAFLIIAHNNWPLLCRLLKKLDHVDHDIYLHIDEKAKIDENDRLDIENSCKSSALHYIHSQKIYWGGYCQIDCELRLMEAANRKKYDYYHVMSGIDFPIKSMAEIHQFFEQNQGHEFVHMSGEEFDKRSESRYEQYHFLQKHVGRARSGFWFQLERVSLWIQRNIFKMKRSSAFAGIQYKGGSNWCSLTNDAVEYLLRQKPQIEKMFQHTICCDEFFVQTMLYNSSFRDKIYYGGNLRSIDWARGNPYTYQAEDYEELISSGNLFCRKVSNADRAQEELIEKLELL